KAQIGSSGSERGEFRKIVGLLERAEDPAVIACSDGARGGANARDGLPISATNRNGGEDGRPVGLRQRERRRRREQQRDDDTTEHECLRRSRRGCHCGRAAPTDWAGSSEELPRSPS